MTFWKKKYSARTNGTMPTSAPTQLRRTSRLSSYAPIEIAESARPQSAICPNAAESLNQPKAKASADASLAGRTGATAAIMVVVVVVACRGGRGRRGDGRGRHHLAGQRRRRRRRRRHHRAVAGVAALLARQRRRRRRLDHRLLGRRRRRHVEVGEHDQALLGRVPRRAGRQGQHGEVRVAVSITSDWLGLTTSLPVTR